MEDNIDHRVQDLVNPSAGKNLVILATPRLFDQPILLSERLNSLQESYEGVSRDWGERFVIDLDT